MKILLKFVLGFVVLVLLLFLGVKACYELEKLHNDYDELPPNMLNRMEYPWSEHKGIVTSVKDYQEVSDIDSNDWIVEFSLVPEEARVLVKKLNPIPEKEKSYRCAISNARWDVLESICSFDAMVGLGFRGYFHNPSLCQAGCKLNVILWVNEQSGKSYIVGSPDYD